VFDNVLEARPAPNVYLLKTLAALTPLPVDQPLLDRLLSILVDQLVELRWKPHVFQNSGLPLWIGVNLHNLVTKR
jgi:hypothetical protein